MLDHTYHKTKKNLEFFNLCLLIILGPEKPKPITQIKE